MKLGIMQPYFFPYIGYFDVIAKTDKWVVFDVVKYQPKSWMNRNRILDPNKGEQYVTVPVDRGSSKQLAEIRIVDSGQAAEKIRRQLAIYQHAAPFYRNVQEIVSETFEKAAKGEGRLRDLDVAGLEVVCRYLDLPFDYAICSHLDLDYSNVTHAGQWALEISDQLGATSYINPSGGTAIFDRDEWDSRGIELSFTRLPDFRYEVGGKFEFRPHLSILDCLMWSEPKTIRDYLNALPLAPK